MRKSVKVFFCHDIQFKLTKMAVLSVVESHKEDLNFLRGQPPQISSDFCKLAWNFLSKGTNLKMYQTAARELRNKIKGIQGDKLYKQYSFFSEKLHVDTEQIQSGVEGLANLFIEMRKNKLNEKEFQETMMELGFSEDSCNIIYSEYINQKSMLDLTLPLAGIQHPQFRNLEWRFDTQVSSRSIKNNIQPRVIVKLDLEKGGEVESCCFQSNIPNMIHLNQVINQAIQDSRTQHCKRIERAVT